MSLAFDATFYQTTRPDVFNAFVATQGSTGLTWAQFAENHYNTFGWLEGSDPSASFDTSYYLSANVDVAAAGVNPFQHFLTFGSLEDRAPFSGFPTIASGEFVPATYAAANPDLATAGITSDAALYQHFVVFGQFESRPGTPTVDTPSTGGQTFTLTAAATDVFQGSAANDTFNAALGTLQTGDTLVGGGGTDTLNATLLTAAQGPVLDGIENLNLSTISAGGNLGLASASGYKAISITGDGAATITGFDQGSAASLTLSSYDKVASVTANDLSGKSDAATLILNGAGTKSGLTLGATAAGALETLNIESSGSAANTVTLAAAGGLNAINKHVLTGTQDLTIKVASAVISGQTVDVSGYSQSLTLDVDRNTATTAATNLTNAPASNIVVRDSTAGGDALVLTNVVDGANVTVATAFAGASSISVKGAGTNSANTLTLTIDNTTDNTDTDVNGAANLSIASVETLGIVSSGGTATGNAIQQLNVSSGSTVNVSGDTKLALGLTAASEVAAVNIEGAGKHTFDFNGASTYDEGKNLAVDASKATSDVTIDVSDFTGTAGGATETVTVTGGAGGDTITAHAGANAASVIDGGAGKDTISSGTNVKATITTGADIDTVSLTNATGGGGSNITDFTLGTGGDILSLNSAGAMTLGGAGATGVDNQLIVINAAVANNAAAQALLGTGNAQEGAVLVLNNASGVAELWYDADQSSAGDGVLLASFENITTVGSLADFNAANFGTWA
jgi:S-layer protein